MLESTHSIHVLHVDDNPSFAEVTATYLERENERIDVRTTTDPESGHDIVATGNVDCIVSDYDMPQTNGIEFLETVREEYSDIPFILYTGKGSEEVAARAISKGVTDYLQKESGPDQYSLLANRIVNAVEQFRAETKLEQQQTIFRTLTDHLPMGVLVEDESRQVLAANSALVELFDGDMSPDELVGRDCAQLARELKHVFAHPDQFVDSISERLDSREPLSGEEFVLDDGRIVERDYIPYDLPDGNANLWVYTDVTNERERQQLLTGLFEESLDGIGLKEVITDEAGEPVDYRYLDVNGSFEELTGLDAEEVIGNRATEVIDGIEETPFIEIFGEVALEGTTARFEQYSEPLDKYYEVSAFSPRRGQCITIFSDITERKKYEQELERQTSELEELAGQLKDQYRYLFEEAPLMAVVTRSEDEGPVIEDSNELFLDTLGYEKEEVVGGRLASFYTPNSRRKLFDENGYERALNGEFVRENRELVAADGTTVETLLRAVPRQDTDDGTAGTLAFYIDISERQELKREKERLEEFTSLVSHDLRNPLNVARSRVELAEDECDSEHLAAVRNAHERMEELIEDLLVYARSGDSIDEMSAVDLRRICESCWEDVVFGEATLQVDATGVIRANRSRLKQLLVNLYQNAIQHGGADVTVTVGELPGGIYVEDDGPGIPPEEREDVFETGYSRATDGTGFGLSIVSEIAAAHGWDVQATDGTGGGARFEITGVEFC